MSFGGIVFATAWASIIIADRTGGVSPLWLANGCALSLLLIGSPDRFRIAMPAAFLAIAAANLIDGSTAPIAFGLAAVNLLEVAFLYVVMRRWRIRPSRPDGLLRFIGASLVAAAASTVAASAILVATMGAPFLSVLPVWFTADLLGLLITVPSALSVSRGEFVRLMSRSQRVTVLACLATVLAVTGLVFAQQPFPLLFLVLPALILSTYLLGNLGATLTNVAVAVVAITMTSAGHGPIAEHVPNPQTRMALVQLFLAVNLLVTFLVASVIKQREHLVNALAEREDRARRLSDNAPAAIVRIGVDGKIGYSNLRFAQLVGRDQPELIGVSFANLLSSDGYTGHPDWSKPTGNDVISLELRLNRPNNSARHATLTATPEYDVQGEQISWIALLVDVTESHEARALLVESERSHRLLAEHSHDMIVKIGMDGVRRFVSPACREVLGYEPHELIGATPVAAIHPDDRARVADVARTLLAGAVNPIATYRQRHRDGHYVWLEAVYRLVRDPATGDPAEFVASVRDISRRLDAERAAAEAGAQLQEANRLLTMAEGLANVGHWRVDTTHNTVFWSHEVYVIHGVPGTYEPVLDKAIEAYHPDDRGRVADAVGRCLEAGDPFQLEARILRPNGEVRWVSTSGRAELAPNDDIIGAVGVFQDITDRITVNQELVAAREAAEAALQTQAIFTATLSHEIRTPLTGVLAAAELLQDAVSPDEQQRFLQTLQHSAELLSSIINDVLVFSKLDQGEVAIEAEPFDPIELTTQVVAAFEGAAEAAGLRLQLHSASKAALVVGDATRIQRVLANLISNALKFTVEGAIDVTIDIIDATASHSWRFQVSDTGVGVSQDKLDRIFEPFVQADTSTTRNYGGTGLGLAICRLLVRAMGGEITAASDGAGAKFTFELPLPPAPPQADDSSSATRAPVVPASILLAEDNPTNRYLITAMLERQGHKVVSVENGLLALREVHARIDTPFDLVLMDVQMPEMDGIAATRGIRLLPEPARSTPIWAITAEDSQQRRAQLLEAGMDEVLAKPLKPDQLASALNVGQTSARLAGGLPASNPEAEMPGEAVFDTAKLASITAALGSVGRDGLLDILIQDAVRLPRIIHECVVAGQTAQAGFEAHSLKGAAAVFGAGELVDAVQAFEIAIKRAEPLEGPLVRLEDAAVRVVWEGRRQRRDTTV